MTVNRIFGRVGILAAGMSCILAAGLFSSALTSCDDDSRTKAEEARRAKQRADSLALKVATTPTLDCLPLFLAEEKGWFDQAGVSVQLRPYTAQMDQDTAVLNHRVEGLTTDRERMKWLAAQGAALSEVAPTWLKWQLVTNKAARLTQLAQLDDHMIAMTRCSATDMLSQRLIDSVGLQPERVFRIQINDVGVRLSMLETGIMDAMLLPEPQATQARNGGHPVLIDTDSLGLRLGVIAFSDAALADTMRAHQIDTFLKVYRQAMDTIQSQGLKPYADIIQRRCMVRAGTVDSLPLPMPIPQTPMP